MAQFFRPIQDISVTSITGNYTTIDESVASDTDFLYSANGISTTYECLLTSLNAPSLKTGHLFRYRISRTNNGVLNTSGTASSVVTSLYQGTTLIASDTSKTAGAWTSYTFTLSEAQAQTITDYSDLRLRFAITGGGGSTANKRGLGISWAELETPNAAPIAYTIQISKGNFSITGKNSSVLKNTIIPISKGSFIDNGKSSIVTYIKRYSISLSKGSFVSVNKDIAFNYIKAYSILSNKGSFVLNNKNISLNYIRLYNILSNKGSFTTIGKNIEITNLNSYKLTSNKGLFNVIVKENILSKSNSFVILSNKGVFTINNKTTTIEKINVYRLIADKTSVILVDKNSFLIKSNTIQLNKYQYSISNRNTSLLKSNTIDAQKYIVSLYLKNASLLSQIECMIDANKGDFSITENYTSIRHRPFRCRVKLCNGRIKMSNNKIFI